MVDSFTVFQIAAGEIDASRMNAARHAAGAMFAAVMADVILIAGERLAIGNVLNVVGGDVMPDAPDRGFRRTAERNQTRRGTKRPQTPERSGFYIIAALRHEPQRVKLRRLGTIQQHFKYRRY